MATKTRTIPAGEFKAKCLALLDEVRDGGEEIVVTKRGKPVAKLVPVEQARWHSLAGSVLWEADDIITPFDDQWEANA
jgi:prevent-host-death family protein